MSVQESADAAGIGAQPVEATEQQKRLALGLISVCHTLNHLQYSITSVIFPVVIRDLGFGLLQHGGRRRTRDRSQCDLSRPVTASTGGMPLDHHDGGRSHRPAGHRLALGPDRQTNVHYPNHLFELGSLRLGGSGARGSDLDHRGFCFSRINRRRFLDLLLCRLRFRTDLDLDHPLYDGALRIRSGVFTRCSDLHRRDAAIVVCQGHLKSKIAASRRPRSLLNFCRLRDHSRVIGMRWRGHETDRTTTIPRVGENP